MTTNEIKTHYLTLTLTKMPIEGSKLQDKLYRKVQDVQWRGVWRQMQMVFGTEEKYNDDAIQTFAVAGTYGYCQNLLSQLNGEEAFKEAHQNMEVSGVMRMLPRALRNKFSDAVKASKSAGFEAFQRTLLLFQIGSNLEVVEKK